MIRLLENICEDLTYQFHYGNKSHLNLIDQNGETLPDKIHLLLFPVTNSGTNFNDSSKNVSGNFFFVVPDTFANAYWEKYENKIEPLEVSLKELEQRLYHCENVDILQFNYVDAIDILDANLTGFWVTFQFKVYE